MEEKKDSKSSEKEEKKEGGKEKKVSAKDKQKQNLMAAIIILGGLFIGSLFVDVAQMMKKEGVSSSKLKGLDVFSLDDQTWIKSDEPIVEMTVLSSKDCEDCQTEPIIDAIKKNAIPTIVVKEVELDSKEGKELVEEFGLKAIPAFIFDKNLAETEFYTQAEAVFEEKKDAYVINNGMAGIPSGKYITLPEATSNVQVLGNDNAPLKVTIFGDFQCPYSKSFADTFAKVNGKYQDQIQVFFRQLPLRSIHPQAYNAALASTCANDQGKFWEMYQQLYANQAEWGASTITEANAKTVFDKYAANLELNVDEFKQCMADEKHKAEIEADEMMAEDYAISGTPAAFVGDQFINGALTEDALTGIVEKQLGINQDEKEEDTKAAEEEAGGEEEAGAPEQQ